MVRSKRAAPEWLLKFLEHRIGDRRVWRVIWRILKSGVMEDGLERASEEGTPQGGSLSALLSNVYLHYVLDLWFERRFKPRLSGGSVSVSLRGRFPGVLSAPR